MWVKISKKDLKIFISFSHFFLNVTNFLEAKTIANTLECSWNVQDFALIRAVLLLGLSNFYAWVFFFIQSFFGGRNNGF